MNLLQFTQTYAEEARAVQTRYGLNPVVVLAVAAWESGWGTSTNAQVGRNFFGIKTGSQPNPYGSGSRPAPDGGSYVVYPSVRSSFLDFGRLLTTRYASVAKRSFEPDAFAYAFVDSAYMTDAHKWTNYYPNLRANIKRFSAALPVEQHSGLALGGLIVAGLLIYLTHKHLKIK